MNLSVFMALSQMMSCFVCLCCKSWKSRCCIFRMLTENVWLHNIQLQRMSLWSVNSVSGKQSVVIFTFRFCLWSAEIHSAPCGFQDWTGLFSQNCRRPLKFLSLRVSLLTKQILIRHRLYLLGYQQVPLMIHGSLRWFCGILALIWRWLKNSHRF